MARTTINLPRYMRGFRLKDGSTGYYWTLPKYAQPPAVRGGRTCPVKSEALGQNSDIAIGKANSLNEIFDGWRLGVEKGQQKGPSYGYSDGINSKIGSRPKRPEPEQTMQP